MQIFLPGKEKFYPALALGFSVSWHAHYMYPDCTPMLLLGNSELKDTLRKIKPWVQGIGWVYPYK